MAELQQPLQPLQHLQLEAQHRQSLSSTSPSPPLPSHSLFQPQPHHPPTLRPGGQQSSPSGSPQPTLPVLDKELEAFEDITLTTTNSNSTTDNMASYQQRVASGPSNGGFPPQSGPPPTSSPPPIMQTPPSANSNPSANANAYSGRFPSQYFGGPQSPTMVEPGTSNGSPFNDLQPSGARSRSSTLGQSYPIPINTVNSQQQQPPPMPISPPQQPPQPLFAQHSGHASSSRPVSRSAASGGPGSMAGGMMPSMPTGGASGSSTRPTSAKSPFSSPITSPPRQRPSQILLINPNSSRSMTDAMMQTLRPNLPNGVEVTGYTAPYPAPTAIESTTDAIMSTEAVLRDLAKHAASNGETVQNFDGMIVACFSKHPLIDALRECYDVPIIGIMEASIYVARMLGGRFGIVATAARSKIMQDDQVAAYGLSHFYVGSEATHLGVLELETRPREDVAKRIAHASRALVVKGADTILLGCAGMVELVRAAKDAVRDEDGRRTVNVIDSVEAGVMMMCSLINLGIPTSKKGMYKGEKEARRTRGQNWL